MLRLTSRKTVLITSLIVALVVAMPAMGASPNRSFRTGAPFGTLVTATATCPTGKVLLGGGTKVTTTDPSYKVITQHSYPSSTANTWTGTGYVLSNLGAPHKMTVTTYAVCSQ